MKNGQFIQNIHPVNCGLNGVALGDMFNGDPASDVISLANHGKLTFLLQKGLGATGTATITVESCDDVTPTTSTAIPFKLWACVSGDALGDMQKIAATGFTTTAGATQLYCIEIDASGLSGTDKYARLQITEVVNDPCGGAVVAILSNGRYVHEIEPSALV